ncbi:MAG: ribose 5-phosphate isomerase B [Ruminococcaceae bacterium]|nr:ribose 5-phosphate isomerase B [Oscillospiraceae bacterium]
MENKNILIGSDHAGYELKLKVIEHLQELGYTPIDVGNDSLESCDYPVFANRLCVGIKEGKAPLGILVCGTGIGMSLVANKHKGIRAACCSDTFSARLTREHNDANVLCFGSRVVGMGLAFDLVDNFLAAEYQGGKHAKRVDMITAVENGNIIL